jgi:hypothetical protein
MTRQPADLPSHIGPAEFSTLGALVVVLIGLIIAAMRLLGHG